MRDNELYGSYKTPYTNVPVLLNVTYSKPRSKEKEVIYKGASVTEHGVHWYEVTSAGFHLSKTFTQAYNLVTSLRAQGGYERYVICKAEVPIFTKEIHGMYGEVCVKKVKYTQIVYDSETLKYKFDL